MRVCAKYSARYRFPAPEKSWSGRVGYTWLVCGPRRYAPYAYNIYTSTAHTCPADGELQGTDDEEKKLLSYAHSKQRISFLCFTHDVRHHIIIIVVYYNIETCVVACRGASIISREIYFSTTRRRRRPALGFYVYPRTGKISIVRLKCRKTYVPDVHFSSKI